MGRWRFPCGALAGSLRQPSGSADPSPVDNLAAAPGLQPPHWQVLGSRQPLNLAHELLRAGVRGQFAAIRSCSPLCFALLCLWLHCLMILFLPCRCPPLQRLLLGPQACCYEPVLQINQAGHGGFHGPCGPRCALLRRAARSMGQGWSHAAGERFGPGRN